MQVFIVLKKKEKELVESAKLEGEFCTLNDCDSRDVTGHDM